MTDADILIVGAGPAGLACAIEANRADLSCIVVDKGVVADAIRRFPTEMEFFSSSNMLEIGDVPFITPAIRPTRRDAVRYYTRVAGFYGLDIQLHEEIQAIEGDRDLFTVTAASGKSWTVRTVVVATGYFDSPDTFTVPGSDLPKVHRYYDEPYAYRGRKVALVGGRNSVVDAALEMSRAGVDVTIIHRGPALSKGVKYWILPDIENRIREGKIRGLFKTTIGEIREESLILEGEHAGVIPNDELFVFIGYTIDPTLLQTAGVSFDAETRAPVHDAQTFETDVPGLFVAGSLAAGNLNNKIFIENGRLHGKAIIRAISEKKNQLEKR
jgi:thioredoxin reductase (NADPH)